MYTIDRDPSAINPARWTERYTLHTPTMTEQITLYSAKARIFAQFQLQFTYQKDPDLPMVSEGRSTKLVLLRQTEPF